MAKSRHPQNNNKSAQARQQLSQNAARQDANASVPHAEMSPANQSPSDPKKKVVLDVKPLDATSHEHAAAAMADTGAVSSAAVDSTVVVPAAGATAVGSAAAPETVAVSGTVSSGGLSSWAWMGIGAVAVGGGALAAGHGGGTSAPTSSQISGKAIDAYLRGATVFFDQDGNGKLDAGEISTTTDKNGNYVLNVPNGAKGVIRAVGGVNVNPDGSDGAPNTATLSAPLILDGNGQVSLNVTPVTTLVQSLIQSDPTLNPAQAVIKLASALGVSGLNLLTFDPIAGESGGATQAIKDQSLALNKVSAQIVSLINSVTASLAADDSTAQSAIAAKVAQVVADQVATQVTTVAAPTVPVTLSTLLQGDSLNKVLSSAINILSQDKTIQAAVKTDISSAAGISSVLSTAQSSVISQVAAIEQATSAAQVAQAQQAIAADTINHVPAAGAAAAVSVPENTTKVGAFAATDPDAGDVLTYTLSGADAAKFTVDSTGAVAFKVAPNFEVDAHSYAINVVATDKAGLSSTQAVTINVTDVNEAPTITASQPSMALVEAGYKLAGTSAATVTLTKADVDAGDNASYDAVAMIKAGWVTADNGVTYTNSGAYGVATLVVATDVVSYQLDNNRDSTNALAKDAVATDSFNVFVKDGSGLTTGVAASFLIKGSADEFALSPFVVTADNKASFTVDTVDQTPLVLKDGVSSTPIMAGQALTLDAQLGALTDLPSDLEVDSYLVTNSVYSASISVVHGTSGADVYDNSQSTITPDYIAFNGGGGDDTVTLKANFVSAVQLGDGQAVTLNVTAKQATVNAGSGIERVAVDGGMETASTYVSTELEYVNDESQSVSAAETADVTLGDASASSYDYYNDYFSREGSGVGAYPAPSLAVSAQQATVVAGNDFRTVTIDGGNSYANTDHESTTYTSRTVTIEGSDKTVTVKDRLDEQVYTNQESSLAADSVDLTLGNGSISTGYYYDYSDGDIRVSALDATINAGDGFNTVKVDGGSTNSSTQLYTSAVDGQTGQEIDTRSYDEADADIAANHVSLTLGGDGVATSSYQNIAVSAVDATVETASSYTGISIDGGNSYTEHREDTSVYSQDGASTEDSSGGYSYVTQAAANAEVTVAPAELSNADAYISVSAESALIDSGASYSRVTVDGGNSYESSGTGQSASQYGYTDDGVTITNIDDRSSERSGESLGTVSAAATASVTTGDGYADITVSALDATVEAGMGGASIVVDGGSTEHRTDASSYSRQNQYTYDLDTARYTTYINTEDSHGTTTTIDTVLAASKAAVTVGDSDYDSNDITVSALDATVTTGAGTSYVTIDGGSTDTTTRTFSNHYDFNDYYQSSFSSSTDGVRVVDAAETADVTTGDGYADITVSALDATVTTGTGTANVHVDGGGSYAMDSTGDTTESHFLASHVSVNVGAGRGIFDLYASDAFVTATPDSISNYTLNFNRDFVDASQSSSNANLTVSGINTVNAGDTNDTITVMASDATALTIDAGAGNDTIYSGSGVAMLIGGAGIDTYNLGILNRGANTVVESGSMLTVGDDGKISGFDLVNGFSADFDTVIGGFNSSVLGNYDIYARTFTVDNTGHDTLLFNDAIQASVSVMSGDLGLLLLAITPSQLNDTNVHA